MKIYFWFSKIVTTKQLSLLDKSLRYFQVWFNSKFSGLIVPLYLPENIMKVYFLFYHDIQIDFFLTRNFRDVLNITGKFRQVFCLKVWRVKTIIVFYWKGSIVHIEKYLFLKKNFSNNVFLFMIEQAQLVYR